MEFSLEVVWFILWGVLWAVYFILDGYDFGIMSWMPLLGYHENDRQSLYKATGPFWDGNEVWLITAAGVTFAAFPYAYAVLFSALYLPLMALLFTLIFRGIVYEFRAQLSHYRDWRLLWDALMFLVSLAIPFLLGVVFANLFKGLPLNGEHHFSSSLLSLFNIYGLCGGVLFVTMFMAHGALFLSFSTPPHLAKRSKEAFKLFWPVFMIVFLIFVVLSFTYAGLQKNYFANKILLIIPAISLFGFLFSGFKMYFSDKPVCAFFGSAVGILALTICGLVGMIPNIIPSSLTPLGNVSILEAASSPLTLKIMLGLALIFVPIVIVYQTWAHLTFLKKERTDGYEA